MRRSSRLAFAAFGSLAASLAAPQFAGAEAINAVFDCEDGQILNVVFDDDAEPAKAVVTIEGQDPVTLPIAMSGTGYGCADGKGSLSGKGGDAT